MMADSSKTTRAGAGRLGSMLDAARTFVAANARVLDRRRFDRLFDGGEAGPVRDAVAAHRNPDGGFGHALEPDGRCPGSQPAALAMALRVLHEADAWDDHLVTGALGWLESVEPTGGGVPFVDPNIEGWPAAPWWRPEPGAPASLITTGPIAGVLLARGVSHGWVDRAADWMTGRLAAPSADLGEYDLRGALAFLAQAPDAAALERLRPMVEASDALGPLDAPALHDDATLAAAREALAAAQQPDGGWTFDWPQWNAAATLEWRGSLTVDALTTLNPPKGV
jgi:hypothetical protein